MAVGASKLAQVGRRNLLLLLLGSGKSNVSEGLGGITRLQKYLFLLEKEEGVQPSGEGFEFTAYKAGPYSSRLYDDLELLENLGLVQKKVSAESTEAEASEVEFGFEDLIEPEHELEERDKPEADAFEEYRYRLTPKGIQKMESLLNSGQYRPLADKIKRIKSKYGRYSLSDLLYYVYTNYPEMATESEIRERVLRRRRN